MIFIDVSNCWCNIRQHNQVSCFVCLTAQTARKFKNHQAMCVLGSIEQHDNNSENNVALTKLDWSLSRTCLLLQQVKKHLWFCCVFMVTMYWIRIQNRIHLKKNVKLFSQICWSYKWMYRNRYMNREKVHQTFYLTFGLAEQAMITSDLLIFLWPARMRELEEN